MPRHAQFLPRTAFPLQVRPAPQLPVRVQAPPQAQGLVPSFRRTPSGTERIRRLKANAISYLPPSQVPVNLLLSKLHAKCNEKGGRFLCLRPPLPEVPVIR